MSEEASREDKTEEPTQRAFDKARERGQVASSREVGHWFIILAGTVFVIMLAPTLLDGLARAMLPFVEQPHALRLDGGGTAVVEVLRDVARAVALAIIVPFCLFMIAGLLAPLVQNGVVVSVEPLKPKLSKISPLKGLQRLFSAKSLMEFTKGLFKLAIVGVVATLLVLPQLEQVEVVVGLALGPLLELMQSLAARLLVGVLAVMSVIAAADVLYQRFEHTRDLRMTRQQLKDEYKESEGDPIVKQRLRQIRMERSRRRMAAAVPEADVVVTNPTHFAVALKYDQAAMQAPVVVAKGADLLARRIREIANENDVPVVENPPLARALYASVEVDQEIPAEHYRTVAEIISYVWRLKGQL